MLIRPVTSNLEVQCKQNRETQRIDIFMNKKLMLTVQLFAVNGCKTQVNTAACANFCRDHDSSILSFSPLLVGGCWLVWSSA
jgi:hypothetical protein